MREVGGRKRKSDGGRAREEETEGRGGEGRREEGGERGGGEGERENIYTSSKHPYHSPYPTPPHPKLSTGFTR